MSESMAQLSLSLDAVLGLVEQAGGELSADLEKELDYVQLKIAAKAEGIRLWADRNREAADGLKALADKYSGMAARRLKAAANVERYLLEHMQRFNRTVIETPLFTIKRARIGKPVIEMDSNRCYLEDFPDKALNRISETYVLDKDAVLKILKKEGSIPSEVGSHRLEFPGGGSVVVTVRERLSVT